MDREYQEALDWYKHKEKTSSREEAIKACRRNIRTMSPKSSAMRVRILQEHFGIYEHAEGDWEAQLNALLSPTTPVYIKE